uniref:Uncharacterized protein n=1 Tax=Trichobilharzia regenti TaxID=157069 RepID=A0AA85IVZ8_TRIRE|nr:unnamed protein product [Trichobilharzia regenti]
MNLWYIEAVTCIAIFFVINLILCLKYIRNWRIERIFLATLLLLWSAEVCLVDCTVISLNCSYLFIITFLEDLLVIILFCMRRRLKIIVAIILAVLSIVCAVVAVVLTFIPWYEDLCKMLVVAFLNTSMCLITLLVANKLKSFLYHTST